LAVVSLDSR